LKNLTRQMKQRLRYIHPILLAVYPGLALWAYNFVQMKPADAQPVILFSLVFGILVFLCVSLIIKNQEKSSLISSLLIILFFTYGHVYELIFKKELFGFVFGRHKVLLLAWVVIFVIFLWWILKAGDGRQGLNRILNWVSIALFLVAVVQLGYAQLSFVISKQKGRSETSTQLLNTTGLSTENLPDVYFIILDGYTRSDTMLQVYGYDNSEFINQLKKLGFVIPACASSNYTMTTLSITSIFNMDYYETYVQNVDKSATKLDFNMFQDHVIFSPVRENFAKLGYKMITFEAGAQWLDITDSDMYIEPDPKLVRVQSYLTFNDFEELFAKTTLLTVLIDAQNVSPAFQNFEIKLQDQLEATLQKKFGEVLKPSRSKYNLLLFMLDQLENLYKIPGKKFVYFHIVAPHRPYVMDRNGNYVPGDFDNPIPGYPGTAAYLDKRLPEILNTIISKSSRPPIIIVQGDHGYDYDVKENRLKILNAYYLPDGGSTRIYPAITPVNTFRIIFNDYFGGHYPLLKDNRYFSTPELPYHFELMPASCQAT
jgi:hypothetical protein